MRRLLSLLILLVFAVPVGVSLSGCSTARNSATGTFCSGSSGPVVGVAQNIALQPQVGGISLGFAQSASIVPPSATDCKGTQVSVSPYKWASSQPGIADINPSTGGVCAGTWNRNNASGIPDYTFCTSTGLSGVSEITASGGGANSNKVLVYVHPQITAITLGVASTDCVNDPATNCPQYTATTQTTAAPYVPNTCISFNTSRQLVARFFAGTQNITYSAGHATFSTQSTGLVTIDDNSGVATAQSPGSTIVTASLANATSTVGSISVCPPKTITISSQNAVNGLVTVNPNNTEPITAVVKDINGVTLTGLSLTFTSTTPIAIPAGSAGITPVFPGTAAITAFCLPPSCNPSPFGTIGKLGNGKPVSSNSLIATTPGSNSTKLFIASTDSIYLVPVDLTTNVVPSPTRLPYVPNSLVLTQNGSTIFMGSSTALMTYNTVTNGVTAADSTVQGSVLAASPDSLTVVVSDPNRKLIYLYQPGSNTIMTTYGGIATRAAFTPDSSIVYITTTDNRLLVYSTFTSWQSYDLSATGANDVAIAVPEVGAFIGGSTAVNGRSYCPASTVTPTVFYPQASSTTVSAAIGDRIAATNDGRHILDVRLAASGAAPIVNDITFPISTANDGTAGTRTFTNLLPTGDCPESGTAPVFGTAVSTAILAGVATPAVTGVYPASDSSIAFTTYLPATGAATTGTRLPAYLPSATGAGTVSNVTLANGATAPVTGVFSSDNKTFFVGTSGDNLVHFITRSTLTDASQLNPKLPSVSTPAGLAIPNLIVQFPRTVTNN